jgi:hypothetical protein
MIEPSHIKPEPKLKQSFMSRLATWRQFEEGRPWQIAGRPPQIG